MRLVTVVGARPQFIKVAAVSRLLRQLPDVQEILIHTGQHYDENMSEIFFRELEIPKPDYFLGVGSGTHGAQTGRMLEAIENVLLETRPDGLLVYGDTNSTLAGSLAASKLHIPVAHVEAGLRSFNRMMPEETNRVLTDHVSDLLFAPTRAAVENLRQEGIRSDRVHLVGDVMYDAAIFYGAKARNQSAVLERFGLTHGEYILATVHRAENTDDATRLRAIISGLSVIARSQPVVFPLHPRTRSAIAGLGLPDKTLSQIRFVDPVGYLDMIMLEQNSRLVATDSGGVQKEAFFFRVPCVTLRNETEWIELVELGWNRLVPPTSADAVRNGIVSALESNPVSCDQPYGEGNSAQRIAEVLCGEIG